MTKVAVVILNWNGIELLQKFLPSVVEYSDNPDISVIIADNGSTDDSVKYVQDNFKQVQVFRMKNNNGFALGYYLALNQIKSEYYVLLNSDVEVTKNWIEPIIDYMDKNPDVAACMPKIKAYNQKDEFEYAGAAGGLIDRYGYPFCRGRILNKIEKDTGQYDEIADIFWATGACLFVKAEYYHNVGGLDGTFFAHMEEIDLCWRLKNMGHRICYIPQSEVYHVGGATLSNLSPQKTFLNFRNNLYLLYKNLPPYRVLFILSFRIILDILAFVKFCQQRFD